MYIISYTWKGFYKKDGALNISWDYCHDRYTCKSKIDRVIMLGEYQVDGFFFDVACKYFGDYILLYDSSNYTSFVRNACSKCLFDIRKRISFDYLKAQVTELSTYVESFNQIDIYLYERFDKNLVEGKHLFYFHQLCSHCLISYVNCCKKRKT